MRLYYHKTSGGAEYLTDKYITCPNGDREGVFEGANYIVRIDGNIERDAEITVKDPANMELLEACKIAVKALMENDIDESMSGEFEIITDAIAKAEGRE